MSLAHPAYAPTTAQRLDRRVWPTDQTGNLGLNVSLAPVLADPIDLDSGTLPVDEAPNIGILTPYGTDAADETGDIAVFLGFPVTTGFADPAKVLQWDWMHAATLRFTLGARTGIAGGVVSSSHRYAKAISATVDATLSPGVRVIGGDSRKSAVFDLLGARRVKFLADLNSSTAAINALFRTA